MNETIGMAVKLVIRPGGICTGCGQPVYAGIYHKCGEPDRNGGPDGPVVEITAPTLPADSQWQTFPPEVHQSTARDTCEACHQPLDPQQFHKCPGNARWHGESQ